MSLGRCGKKGCRVCRPEGMSPIVAHVDWVEHYSRTIDNQKREIAALKKELAGARRLNRRYVYNRIFKAGGVDKNMLAAIPGLKELVERCGKAHKRLLSVRNVRKERLLREMRPSDLRALGLTPPPQSKPLDTRAIRKFSTLYRFVQRPNGDCSWCSNPMGQHAAKTLACPLD